MLALANPRPAATSTSGSGRGLRPRSRRSSTLPSHLLSGYANGPDAGRAPSRLMRSMTASTRGSHRGGGGSGPGCGVGASAEEDDDGEADTSAAASSFENVFLGGGWNEGDDDDAIPLVALSGRSKAGGKMKGRMMELDDDDQQQKENGSSPIGSSSSGRRRKRVYRYVSHGIGGAGNFRRVLTSFRSDITTTDPSFARNHQAAKSHQQHQRQASSGPDPGPSSSTICACSRCFSSGSSGKKVPSTGSSGASGRTSTAGSGSATARA